MVGTERGPDSADIGSLLQPCEWVGDALAAGRLGEVFTDFTVPTRPFHSMYAPDRRMTSELHSFIDFVVAAIGADTKKERLPMLTGWFSSPGRESIVSSTKTGVAAMGTMRLQMTVRFLASCSG